jgi:hypothetical protein
MASSEYPVSDVLYRALVRQVPATITSPSIMLIPYALQLQANFYSIHIMRIIKGLNQGVYVQRHPYLNTWLHHSIDCDFFCLIT